MKQFYTAALTLLISSSIPCFGQLKVASTGNVSVKSNATPLSTFAVNAAGSSDNMAYILGTETALYSTRQGAINWGKGVMGQSFNENTNFSVGVEGRAITPNFTEHLNSGRSFGVLGMGGFATDGYNYGVFGRLMGTNKNGAGVYGTSNATDNGIELNERYAGYFNGEVEVSDKLTVRGGISGTLLSASVITDGLSSKVTAYSASDEEETFCDKLSTLEAFSFYEQPTIAPLNAQASGDTLTTSPKLSAIETQRLAKKHYALSADQLEAAFPDLVYEDENGTRYVNYVELVPILVHSLNELRAELAAMKNAGMKQPGTAINADLTEQVRLAQNDPNPFSTTTSISMTIPTSVKEATLYVYDLNGKEVMHKAVTQRGTSATTLSASELEPGIYIYSLVTDGTIVETRKMFLTK